MAETAAFYEKTLPPHIRAADSLPKRFWGQLLALAPVLIALCLTGRAEILRILSVCLVSAVAFEFLAAKIFRKKENLRSGETLLAAALFALLMPSRCPSEILILGVFFAIVAGKELLGGTGSYLFHPLLLSRAFLQISFPRIMTEPMLLVGGSLWTLAAIGLGGVVILKRKRGYWETPVLFLAVCFLCETLSGGGGTTVSFLSGALLTAFFLLADPVAMPLTRQGVRIFVIGAAFLSSRLISGGFSIRTAGHAILLMNLLTPWLELWLKPAPYKTKRLIKATYPS